jgi:uncharacterized membrane protein
MNTHNKNWHEHDMEKRSMGDRAADWVAEHLGSWEFIIIQTIIVIAWIIFNLIAFTYRWDPYPFILLNLLFSTQASYAAPIIMMSQNRQADRDRVQAHADYETNIRAKEEIEQLQDSLTRIENEKLDRIIELLQGEQEKRVSKKIAKQKTTM